MPATIGSTTIGSTAIGGNPAAGQQGKFLQVPRFRVRVIHPVDGSVVIDRLPHVVVEYETIFPQLGMAGTSAIGAFTVHLFHPLTDEYAWAKVWYDKLDQMQRVELYMIEDPDGYGAAGDPVFTGIIENLPKEDFSFRIEGEDSLKLLDLSRTLGADTFTGPTSDLVRYALKTYRMTKGEDFTGNLSTYTNDGTWALTTDQGFSSVKNGSTSDGLLFTTASYANDKYADCFVEAPYRLICPTNSFAEAGVVAAVTDSNNLIMGRALMRWVAPNQYAVDAEIWQKTGGAYGTVKASKQGVISETTPNSSVTVTLQGVQTTAYLYTWKLLVNEIDSGCTWTQQIAAGAQTGGIGLRATFTAGSAIVQHHLVFMSKSNAFQPGNIVTGQQTVNQSIASQANLNLLQLAASTEGNVWFKRPKPGLNNDLIDFADSVGGDLSGIVRFEQDIHIVSSQSERNAEPLNTAVLAAGHPSYNNRGKHRWFDITAINRRGFAIAPAVMPETSDTFALRQMSQNVLVNRTQPTQAKRITVLRTEDHAELPGQPKPTGMAYRDGDWVTQHEPRKGINYQRVQIMSAKVTGGLPTLELTLDQYPVVTDREPLLDRLHAVVGAAQLQRFDASEVDPATGVYHDARGVLPYNPWSCRLRLAGTMSLTSGAAATPILFDVVDYDPTNGYNTSTYQWTVPVSGRYKMVGKANVSSGAGLKWLLISIRFYQNGIRVTEGVNANSGDYTGTAGMVLDSGYDVMTDDAPYLNAGDLITLQVGQVNNAGTAKTLNGGLFTYAAIHLLSGGS